MKYFVEALDSFNDWLRSLRDIRAKVAIVRRIDRAGLGNFGDHKAVGEGVSEMRIDIGQDAGFITRYVSSGSYFFCVAETRLPRVTI